MRLIVRWLDDPDREFRFLNADTGAGPGLAPPAGAIGTVEGPPPPAPVTPSWPVLSTGLTNLVTPWPDHARQTEVIFISPDSRGSAKRSGHV